MEQRRFGNLDQVRALTLGGGGTGQVWGPTSQQEAVATVKAAVDWGITFLDAAPTYGDGKAEDVIGEVSRAERNCTSRAERNCTTERRGVSIKVPWSVRA